MHSTKGWKWESILTPLLSSILSTTEYRDNQRRLPLALGTAETGKPLIADLAKMPHLLIAGATGSGKSVCLHNIVISLLVCDAETDLLLIDTKRVELSVFAPLANVCHVYEVANAKRMLYLQTLRMEYKYLQMEYLQVRNIQMYNAKSAKSMVYNIVIVDEFADLILQDKTIEAYVVRLAQMGRAAGIHLVLATQRPTVNVVTGLIKANFPARIAFPVATTIDSRVILDRPGAEDLENPGDMIYSFSRSYVKAKGAWVAPRQIENFVTTIARKEK